MNEEFKSDFLKAVIHCGYSLLYVCFIVPLELWVKAIERLSEQKNDGSLRINKIGGIWPYFTFVKNLLTEFIFDFLTFIFYFIGVLMFFYVLIEVDFRSAVSVLVTCYYAPVYLAIFRDVIQLILLPIRKLLSFFRKPAQYYDLDVKEEEIKK